MEQLIKFFEKMADKCNVDWPMPIEAQLKILSKKYEAKMEMIEQSVFDRETEETTVVEKEFPICRFKDVICKYRPHLHLGDIWVAIIPIMKGKYDFMCKSYVEEANGDLTMKHAQHPHISQGRPCLGNFAPELIGSLQSGNLIRFFSQFKLYLSAYNGRSTFTRGGSYRKQKYFYKMHSEFFAREEYPDVDNIYEVMQDPMRWTLPEGLSCTGTFMIEGQEREHLRLWLREDKGFFFQSHIGYSHSYDHSEELMKINGYIVLLNKICNVGILRSYKLMSAWLEVLSNECSGIRDEELIKRLQEINRKYSNMRYGDYQVTQRYQISLTDEERQQMNKDRAQIQTVIGDDSQRMIVTMLKYPGDIHSKFLALFKSGNLHKAKIEQFVDKTIYQGYKDKLQAKGTDSLLTRYENLQAEKIKLALTTLEKDKRRMLNELNKSKAIYRQNDGGQSSLFSDEI